MQAILHSNRGHAKLDISLTSSRIDVDGKWLDIDLSFARLETDFDATEMHFCLSNVLVLALEIDTFSSRLDSWVQLPLEIQEKTPLLASIGLGRSYGEIVALEFGPRKDVVCERKPIFTFRYEDSATRIATHFITDQSCIRSFAESLTKMTS